MYIFVQLSQPFKCKKKALKINTSFSKFVLIVTPAIAKCIHYLWNPHRVTNSEELWHQVNTAYQEIPQNILFLIINSISNRVIECIQRRSGSIYY